jgi:hypothetical protein
MYFYENHLGGNIYTTDYEQDYDDLYCDECGDSDTFLGEYDSWIDFIKDLDPDCYPFYCTSALAEEAGITVEEVYAINPKIKKYDADFAAGFPDEEGE